MFHFPTFPPTALCVQAEVTGHDSSWVSPFGNPRINSLVANFPGLIAGSYVLHRLLVPRHPPCALSSLSCYKDARVHCVVLKLRAVPHQSPRLPGRWPKSTDREFEGVQAQKNRSQLDPSGPNSVPGELAYARCSSFHAPRPRPVAVLTSSLRAG